MIIKVIVFQRINSVFTEQINAELPKSGLVEYQTSEQI